MGTAKRYVEGMLLVNVSRRSGGYSAEWGTERNVMLRDWYWLFGAAGAGVIQQN